MRTSLALVCLLLISSTARAQEITAHGISGVVQLGESRYDVKQRLGKPDSASMSGDLYKAQGIYVIFKSFEDKVESIYTFNPKHQTTKGVHVGDSFAAVRKAYGAGLPGSIQGQRSSMGAFGGPEAFYAVPFAPGLCFGVEVKSNSDADYKQKIRDPKGLLGPAAKVAVIIVR